MSPDVILQLRFATAAEGGRATQVRGPFYSCPLFVDGLAFDCRLLLDGRTLELGANYEIGAKFLDPELALPRLEVGKAVTLWEGRVVASGHVVAFGQNRERPKFVMTLRDAFAFEEGRTVLIGEIQGAPGFIGACECELLIDGARIATVKIEGEMLPLNRQGTNLRSVSTVEKLSPDLLLGLRGDVKLREL